MHFGKYLSISLFTLTFSGQMFAGDGVGWPQALGNESHTAARYMPLKANFSAEVLWYAPLGYQAVVDQSPVVSPTNSRIYIGTIGDNPGLVALNKDGTQAWKSTFPVAWHRTETLQIRATPTILSNGSLLVPGYIDISYVDRTSGKNRWTALSSMARVSADGVPTSGNAIAGKITSSPLRLSDNEIYLAFPEKDNADPKLFLINQDLSLKEVSGFHRNVTGGLPDCIWPVCFDSSGVDVFDPNNPPFQPLLPSPTYNSIYKQVVTAVNVGFAAPARAGTEKSWQNANLKSSISPVLVNGTIFTSEPGGVVRLSTGLGKSSWSYKIGSEIIGSAAVSVQGSNWTYFVSTADGYLNAVSNGKLLWRKAVGQSCNAFDPKAECIGSPAVMVGGNKHQVVVHSNYDSLYFFDADGTFRLTTPLHSGAAPSRGTPAIADGRIYAVTRSSVIAVELK